MRYILVLMLAMMGCESDVPSTIVPSEVKMTPICAVAWQADGTVLRERNCHLERETTGFYRLTLDRPVHGHDVIVQVMPSSPAYPNYAFASQENLMYVQMVGQSTDYFYNQTVSPLPRRDGVEPVAFPGIQYQDVIDSGGSLVVYALE